MPSIWAKLRCCIVYINNHFQYCDILLKPEGICKYVYIRLLNIKYFYLDNIPLIQFVHICSNKDNNLLAESLLFYDEMLML